MFDQTATLNGLGPHLIFTVEQLFCCTLLDYFATPGECDPTPAEKGRRKMANKGSSKYYKGELKNDCQTL